MKRLSNLLTGLCVAASLLAGQVATAQPPGVPATPSPRTGPAPRAVTVGDGGMVTLAPHFGPQDKEFREALQSLRNAESEADREAARSQLREALGNQYDRAMDDYEEYIADLAKRVEELREQVGKRRAAREKMIELRLQMLVSEADGLGWPGSGNTWRGPFPGAGLPGGFMPEPAELMPDVPDVEPFDPVAPRTPGRTR